MDIECRSQRIVAMVGLGVRLALIAPCLFVLTIRSLSSKILHDRRSVYMSASMTAGELIALARRAQNGDETARKRLLEELYCVVRRHIYLLLGSSAIVEDAVQETMTAVNHGLSGFRGDTASPVTWALAIATRHAYRLRAREARYVLVDDGTVDMEVFDVGPAAAAELAMLQSALAGLTQKKRCAFVLMEIFDLTADEAGRALGIRANTAASQCRHARHELQAYFKKFDESWRLDPTEATDPVGV